MILKLKHGKQVTVDDDWVNPLPVQWYMTAKGYVRASWVEDGKRHQTSLHRLVIGAKKGEIVDHINGDTTDNRRANLRIVTYSQSNMNKGPHKGKISKYRGVYRETLNGNWYARIDSRSLYKRLGTFKSEEEAARAYDKAAKEAYGEYARLNFASE